MESFLTHLIHFALWVFVVTFAFAVVGVVATIRWIANLMRRTTEAVETGVADVEHAFKR